MKKVALIALTLGVLVAPAAQAGPAVAADQAKPAAQPATDARTQHVCEFLKAAGLTKIAGAVMDQMLPAMRDECPSLSDKEYQDLSDEMRAEFSEDRLASMLAPIYARHFSDDEIQQLCAFYSTPIGKKLIAEQPDMMSESMSVGQKFGQEAAMRFLDKISAKQKVQSKAHGHSKK